MFSPQSVLTWLRDEVFVTQRALALCRGTVCEVVFGSMTAARVARIRNNLCFYW